MKRVISIVVFLAGISLSGWGVAAESSGKPAPTEMEKREIIRDCRMEGEGGGLKGKVLEAFVSSCVKDLLGVEFDNIIQL